jgi:formamidopyrimidine-DNA glycosylase
VPELPEVETVVRELRPLLVGRRFRRVRVGRMMLRRGLTMPHTRRLVTRKICNLTRRGKWIVIDLDRGCLLIHLGMTGQLTIGPADRPVEPHTHVLAELDDGSELRFRDVRRFGGWTYFSNFAKRDQFLRSRLGPEPFELQRAVFQKALRATSRPLKAALLDQALIAGLGNIYADESLFAARLSPLKRGVDTSPSEAARLLRCIVRTLHSAIAGRGSSIRDYVGGNGRRGGYQDKFRVYGRGGESCRRCQRLIQVVRLAGRSTHFCPCCQAP